MPAAPALLSAVRASADARETAVRAQIAHPLEQSLRPMNGLPALKELPAGGIGATTVRALFSRISDSTQVPFDGHLRDLCDDLVATFGRSGGPKLTHAAADAAVPIGAAIALGLIADLLITNAFLYAFPPGRGGRIAVSFAAGQEAWELIVEDSGIAVQGDGDRRDHGLRIARQLVSRLGGRLEIPGVTGGTRCIVTLPRPRA